MGQLLVPKLEYSPVGAIEGLTPLEFTTTFCQEKKLELTWHAINKKYSNRQSEKVFFFFGLLCGSGAPLGSQLRLRPQYKNALIFKIISFEEVSTKYNKPKYNNMKPESGCHKGQFTSHSKDCNKYYQCLWGAYKEIRCSPGLYWNKVRPFAEHQKITVSK